MEYYDCICVHYDLQQLARCNTIVTALIVTNTQARTQKLLS